MFPGAVKESVWSDELVPIRQPYLFDGSAFHIRVQLLQQSYGLFSTELAHALILKEKVDSQVGISDKRWIKDREVANARQNEILQSLDACHARSAVDEKDVCLFKRFLSTGTPQAQLTIVFLFFGCRKVVKWWWRGGSFGCHVGEKCEWKFEGVKCETVESSTRKKSKSVWKVLIVCDAPVLQLATGFKCCRSS